MDRYLTGQYHDQAWRDNFLNTLLQRLHPTRNELSALFGLIRNLAKKPARLEQAADKAAKAAKAAQDAKSTEAAN
jgi:tRNA/rRNA methyltransferase/tRNA (cytidine32/uridine32-2'-O)-methyltransferase